MMKRKNKTVVVDDGFAYSKVAWFDDQSKTIKFTSIPSLATAGLVASGFDGKLQGGYISSGLEYTVGENITNPHDTRDDSYPYSAINRCIVNHALRSAGFGVVEDEVVNLGLTIPMKPYFDLGRDVVIEKRRASYRNEVTAVGAASQVRVDCDSLVVMPEAASAWVDYMLDDLGGDAADIDESIAVFDVGGRTTDTAVIMRGGAVDRSASGTDMIGVLDLLEMIRREVLIEHKVELTIQNAERTLRDPLHMMPKFDKKVDISDIIDRTSRKISEQLYQLAMRRIGDGASLSSLLFVGGGAAVLSESLSIYPHVKIPQNPEFSNARGALKYMLYKS